MTWEDFNGDFGKYRKYCKDLGIEQAKQFLEQYIQQQKEFTLQEVVDEVQDNTKTFYSPKKEKWFTLISKEKVVAMLKRMVVCGLLQVEEREVYEFKEIPNLLYRNKPTYRKITKIAKYYKKG